MSSNIKDYAAGRDDGLLKAYQIVKDKGLDGLREELRFRGATKIHTSYAVKELDEATERIKEILFETIRISMVAILHDEFGFGQKRCQHAIDAFDKLTMYLDRGWLYWVDLIDEIRQRLRLTMTDDIMKASDMGGKYSHPAPEDIYDEPDLVDQEHWKHLLKSLGFSERKNPNGKSYDIFNENGAPIFRYEGQYTDRKSVV